MALYIYAVKMKLCYLNLWLLMMMPWVVFAHLPCLNRNTKLIYPWPYFLPFSEKLTSPWAYSDSNSESSHTVSKSKFLSEATWFFLTVKFLIPSVFWWQSSWWVSAKHQQLLCPAHHSNKSPSVFVSRPFYFFTILLISGHIMSSQLRKAMCSKVLTIIL